MWVEERFTLLWRWRDVAYRAVRTYMFKSQSLMRKKTWVVGDA
jgi:hypothetical protein